MPARLGLAAVLLPFLFAAACGGATTGSLGSSSSSWGSSGTSSTPTEPPQDSPAGSPSGHSVILPQCPTNEAPRSGNAYEPSALPSGACSNESECQLAVVDCPCGDYPVDGYACSCTSGQWSCKLVTHGKSTCSCPEGGAGGQDAPACSYPPANDPRCPSSYSFSYYQQPCYPLGLYCQYPGQDGFGPNPCAMTAMMWCRDADGGPWDLDGGTVDASGVWTVAQ